MENYFKFLLGTFVLLLFLITVQDAYAPPPPPPPPSQPIYTDSAHGNSTYGVNRTSLNSPINFGYSTGNCAHCHEQHASIGGSEPNPIGGPSKFCLLADNFSGVTSKPYSQSDNVCFYCHIVTGTFQSSAFNNYSYSYTFGGCSSTDCPTANIFDAFNGLSYHNLNDILNFAKATWSSTYTADSNPCSACHNIHIARRSCGKPSGSFDTTKSAISRPSDHGNLWGDEEKMSNYTTGYQAPYYNSAATYEPDGSAVSDPSKLPDYVTFCTDCHNATNVIYSTRKSGNLRFIDWSAVTGDKHGGRNYVDSNMYAVPLPYVDKLDARAPYGTTGTNYVLSCLDCHEPHGSSNIRLIRRRVNGADLANAITTYDPGVGGATAVEWKALCERCHVFPAGDGTHTGNYYLHHSFDEAVGAFDMSCFNKCHDFSTVSGANKPCMDCHFHGSLIGVFSAAPNANLQTRTF